MKRSQSDLSRAVVCKMERSTPDDTCLMLCRVSGFMVFLSVSEMDHITPAFPELMGVPSRPFSSYNFDTSRRMGGVEREEILLSTGFKTCRRSLEIFSIACEFPASAFWQIIGVKDHATAIDQSVLKLQGKNIVE